MSFRSAIGALCVLAGVALAGNALAADDAPSAAPAPPGDTAPAPAPAPAPAAPVLIPADAPEAPPAPVGPDGPTPPPPAQPGPTPLSPPPPPTAPGSARGLYPSVEQQWCDMERCFSGMVEVRTPLYDPTGRFVLPWTGQWNPSGRGWTLFGAETITYDSNIFATDKNVEDDFISNTSVGASLRREGSAFWALATASLTYQKYFDHENEDGLSFFGHFELGWKGAATYAAVEDTVAYAQAPLVVRDDRFVIVDQDRHGYWQNTFRARAGYECVRWRSELSYRMGYFHADGGVIDAYNHVDHTVMARFDYYLTEKTSLGAFASARWVPYESSTQRDFTVWSGGGTFSWRPTSKFGLLGMVGAGFADSDSGATLTTFVGSLDATWDATENLTLFIGWQRNYEASLGADYQIIDVFRVRAQAVLADCWTLNGIAGVQFGDTHGSTADGAKDYTLWFFDLMVHRAIGEHFGFDAGYQYRNQDADQNGIDFEQHRITVGLSFAF